MMVLALLLFRLNRLKIEQEKSYEITRKKYLSQNARAQRL